VPCGHPTFHTCLYCNDAICENCIWGHQCPQTPQIQFVQQLFGDSNFLAPTFHFGTSSLESPFGTLPSAFPEEEWDMSDEQLSRLIEDWLNDLGGGGGGDSDQEEDFIEEEVLDEGFVEERVDQEESVIGNRPTFMDEREEIAIEFYDEDFFFSSERFNPSQMLLNETEATSSLHTVSDRVDQQVEVMMQDESDEVEIQIEVEPPGFQTVPLNEAYSTIKIESKPPTPVALGLRCMLWNVANLGGKFGYPKVRAPHTMSAIARVIHHARPDFVSILEVLDRYTERMPKAPIQLRVNSRHDVFDRIFKVSDAREKAGLASDAKRGTASKKRSYIEMDKGLNEAKRKRDEAVDRTTDVFEDAVNRIVWNGEPVDTLEAEMTDLLQGIEDRLERLRDDLEEDGGIDHLTDEGYTHWAQVYKGNYTVADKKKSPEMKEKDETSQRLVKALQAGVLKCWAKFLAKYLGAELTKAEAQAAFTLLVDHDFKARESEYKKRVAAIKLLQKSVQKGEQPHDGLKEFFRIRDELNKLSDGAYESWPDKLPEKGADIYTCGESYGVLWRKDRFTNIEGKVEYAGTHHKVNFLKREPIRVPLRLNGGPVVVFFPWHAPSPCTDNAKARGVDFRAFVDVCKAERKADNLAIVLSDLNIDTKKDGTDIEHCVKSLGRDAFFTDISGGKLNKDYDHSTLVITKVVGVQIDDLDVRLHDLASQRGMIGAFSSGESILNLIANFVPKENQKGKQDKRSIQAHGASAYDKILAIHRRSPTHRVEPRGDVVIPFAQALAFEEEMPLFPPEPIGGGRFPSFACLLERTKADETLAAARTADKPHKKLTKGVDQGRLIDLIKDARRLSDHMPLLADFVIRPIGEKGQALTTAEPNAPQHETTKPEDPPKESELEKLCRLFEAESDEGKRSDQLQLLLLKVQNPGEDESEAAAIRLRIQRALDRGATVEGERGDQASSGKERKPVSKGSVGYFAGSDTLKPLKNGGGGDCLFRSLSQLVYGSQAHHAIVRTQLVAHLLVVLSLGGLDDALEFGPEVDRQGFRERMRELYDWHQTGWPNASPYSPRGLNFWLRYMLEMARPGVWGDLIVLCAASHFYGLRIKLLVQIGDRIFEDCVHFCKGGHDVAIYNINNYHFEACSEQGLEPVAILEPPPLVLPLVEIENVKTKKPTPKLPTLLSSISTSSKPVPVGPVFLWPSDDKKDFWDIPEAKKYTDCIFVFGENHADRLSHVGSGGTQANIRGQANAFGVRTCLKPGANESSGGAMLDTDFASSCLMIDKDIHRIKLAIDSKNYKTLIIPWFFCDFASTDPTKNHTKGVALGAGIALLPSRAPKTFQYLSEQIDELIKYAKLTLPVLTVDTRGTGAQRNDAVLKVDTLFVYEDSDLLRKTPPTLDKASVSLRGLPNALGVRTSHKPCAIDVFSGQMTDGDTGMIDEDLKAIFIALQSGKYKRLSLPWNLDGTNTTILGTTAKLEQHAPKAFQHLQEQMQLLCKACGAIVVEGVRTGLGKPSEDIRWNEVKVIDLPKDSETTEGQEGQSEELDETTVEHSDKKRKFDNNPLGTHTFEKDK